MNLKQTATYSAALLTLALLAGCGVDTMSAAATAAAIKKQELQQGQKTMEQATDVARSTATGVDRVSSVSVKMSGQKLAPFFDGSEQLISVTSIPWYSRQVYLPTL